MHVSNELDYPLDTARIAADVRSYGPGLICFSITTNQWYFARQIGRALKNGLDVPVIVGGHHPTAAPDMVLEEPWVDMLCRGEGDYVLPEVIRRLEAAEPMDGINNLVHRKGDDVVKEPMGAFPPDLDALPFEDRGVFDYTRLVETRSGWAEVIVTRGCPYPCTYCFNQPLFDEYRRDIKKRDGATLRRKEFTRRRSVDSTIRMLKEIRAAYPNIKHFTFVDDIMAEEGGGKRKNSESSSSGDQIQIPSPRAACKRQKRTYQ